MSPLTPWANFYVITGGAAATLTGLMFVVITLVAGRAIGQSRDGLGVYSTPTVVNFGATILIGVLLSAPWPELWQASIPLGLLGAVGLLYGGIVARRAVRASRRAHYHPVLEDWLCHAVLPPLGYATLVAAALALPRRPIPALFGAGGVIVLFLILGIHNAWDVVTYLTVEQGLAGDRPAE